MIQADPATNSLIISAPEPLYRNIRSIIDRLDVRPAQVMIESLVVELTGQKAAEFGIQWQALNGLSNVSSSNSTQFVGGTNFTNGTGSGSNIVGLSGAITSPAPGLNLGIIKGQITIGGTTITNVGLLARALQTLGNTNILSRPNIQTLDNEEGKFLVGQNVGLLTGAYANTSTSTSTVNPFQTFERHDVGLQLAIKPQISEGGTVRLAIYIEDSSVASGSSADNPTLNKRSFQTNVLVEDGSFVVISGLIQDQADETQSKVPILGDIPLIGRLFRYDTRDHTKTQTMVFLRPTIIRDETQAADIAVNRYDYIRAQVAQSHQGNLAPLPNLSVEDLPAIPKPTPPKAGQSAPTTPSETPGAQSLPVAPEPAPQTTSPRSSADPGDRAQATPGASVPAVPPTSNPPASVAPQAAAAAPTLASSAGASPYQLIQISAVPDISHGRELQQRLKQAGFDSYWESVSTPQGDVVRIRVSVERQAARIADAMSLLRQLGYDPVLVGR
jgi:general secretion pathway protein D